METFKAQLDGRCPLTMCMLPFYIHFLLLLFFCEWQRFFSHVFNGCYAVLMFIVVVFFLIYGVEVYFKVGTNPHFIDSKVMSSLSSVLSGVLKIIHPLVFGFNCLHRRFLFPFFTFRYAEGFWTMANLAFHLVSFRSKPLRTPRPLRIRVRLLPLLLITTTKKAKRTKKKSLFA